MTRISLIIACMTSISLVLGHFSLLADDKFILQPKIHSPIIAVHESSQESPASQNLVLQPLDPDAAMPALGSQGELKPELDQDPRLSPARMTQQNVQLSVEPSIGLMWVKRGSPSASVSAAAGNSELQRGNMDTASLAAARSLHGEAMTYQQSNLKTPVSTTGHTRNIQQTEITTVSVPTHGTRAQLASMISKKILGESSAPKYFMASGPSLMGPAAVERELTDALTRSEQLCRRGVFLSAREEAKSAELQLARYLDSISNSFKSEPKLRAAKIALREVSDFSQPCAPKILHELISAHETPVLKDVDVSQASPLALMQSYYQYAESLLLEGSQQHPWYSDVFYTLGRTYQAEADNNVGDACEHLRVQAMVYYRAASTIRPTNALATNQLGYVLLQLDRPAEAMTSLIASVDTKLDVPALQNLAEASRRLGDQQMQRWALEQIGSINQRNPKPQGPSPAVVELDNAAFAATTPIVPFGVSTENRTANIPAGNRR
jgi:tetratricopeptide (TPR) repeat protein